MPQFLVLDPDLVTGTTLARERTGVARRAPGNAGVHTLHELAATE
jgi:hypothetical protein